MNVFVILIIISSILQVIVCKFSLWWIICLVARILFSLRILGATFNVKKLCIVEGVGLGCMLLFNMLFNKGDVPWFRILLFALFCAFNCAMMLLDDILYVYVIEDDDPDD